MRRPLPELSNDRFVGPYVRWILRGLTGLALAWILLPCAYLFVWAFCGTDQRDRLGGGSWHWFEVLLSDRQWRSALGVSLGYAALCPIVACGLIALFSYSIHFAKRRLEVVSGSCLLIVLLTPSVSLALAYKYFMGVSRVPAPLAYAVGNTLLLLPVAYAVFEAGQSHVSRERLQAGTVLGATHLKNFIHVFLPQAWRPLLSAYVLCFLASLDESVFAVTLFDNPPFPVTKLLWDLVSSDISPRPAAAVLLLAGLSGALFWSAAWSYRQIRTRLKSRRKYASI